jgi:methylglutaconyl-CoA hydratase
MKNFKTILYQEENHTGYLTLNRPEVRNAFNDQMIKELHSVFDSMQDKKNLKALLIKGNGAVFSAGADLNWMKKMKDYSYDENLQDSKELYELFDKLYHLPFPTLTVIHGASIGGANGLLAASDIVLAESQAQFRFSEVKLGLIPATIAPFVIKRIGEYAARYYMLTGKTFGVGDALRIGLIDSVGNNDSIETEIQIILSELNQNSPEAVRKTKKLINQISQYDNSGDIKKQAIETIANARISEEGQEGMEAFLSKRKPQWIKE